MKPACTTLSVPNKPSLSSRSFASLASASHVDLSPGLTIHQKQTARCSNIQAWLSAPLYSPGDRRVWRTYLLYVSNRCPLFFFLAQLSSAYSDLLLNTTLWTLCLVSFWGRRQELLSSFKQTEAYSVLTCLS